VPFALLAGLIACAGGRVYQDYDSATDFSVYHTYDWYPGERTSSGNVHLDSPLLEQRVINAVDRALAARGYAKFEDESPDFYVNYFFTVETRLQSSGVDYRVGTYGRHGGVSVGTGDRLREVDEATLVIDILDARSGDLAWRGTRSRRVKLGATPEHTTRLIDEAVSAILTQFPPH
jgi:hypothetical protein